jgi:hypothetical protein
MGCAELEGDWIDERPIWGEGNHEWERERKEGEARVSGRGQGGGRSRTDV